MKKTLIARVCVSVSLAAVMNVPFAAVESKAPVDGVASITRVAAKNTDREEIVNIPSSVSVNPMTGRTTKYEDMEQSLREKTLEAKIAEQDFAIAKSRTEAKKLGTERQQVDAVAPARVPDDVRVQAQKVLVKKVVPAKRGGKVADTRPDTSLIPAAPYRAPDRPRLLGVMESGGEKVAMVSFGGRTSPIKEGTSENGLSVASITKFGAVINGVTTSIEKGVSTVNLPETHQAVVPGASLGQAASPVQRGVVVQGVNTAAIQPVPSGSPIPAGNTQPTRFPNDLYNR